MTNEVIHFDWLTFAASLRNRVWTTTERLFKYPQFTKRISFKTWRKWNSRYSKYTFIYYWAEFNIICFFSVRKILSYVYKHVDIIYSQTAEFYRFAQSKCPKMVWLWIVLQVDVMFLFIYYFFPMFSREFWFLMIRIEISLLKTF